MHLLTLSFDDGFLKSSRATADIYERHGLAASFNVLATGHNPAFVAPDRGQTGVPKGDFALWNELKARGHEVMPHGYRHADKSQIPFEEAQRLLLDCFAIFADELAGFSAREAFFAFPYNRSTPELEAWLPTVVRGFRTSGGGLNPLPTPETVKLTTCGFGPENCEAHLDAQIEALLAMPSGWLIYNTHGLDDEGWGPIRATYLDDLLGRLKTLPAVRVVTVAEAFETVR